MTVVRHPSGSIPSVSGQSGNLLSTNGSELVWSAPTASGSMTLLSTTTLSGTSVTVSSISQAYNDLLILVESPRWGTADDQFWIQPNAATTAFMSGVSETSTGTFGAVGINGSNIAFTSSNQDMSTYGSFYCVRITDYAKTYGGNTSGKPLQFWGTLVAGDQRSFNFAGAFVNSVAIDSIKFRTNNNYTFSSGTVRIYGVK